MANISHLGVLSFVTQQTELSQSNNLSDIFRAFWERYVVFRAFWELKELFFKRIGYIGGRDEMLKIGLLDLEMKN